MLKISLSPNTLRTLHHLWCVHLQIIQNSAARLLTHLHKWTHISPILPSLHWLPVEFRIQYKILFAPIEPYMVMLLNTLWTSCSYTTSQALRSTQQGLLSLPQTLLVEITYYNLLLRLWNSLPPALGLRSFY